MPSRRVRAMIAGAAEVLALAAADKTGGLKPDVAKEAKDINDTVAGWAYKVPRYKGVLLSTPMEDLLRPVGTPPGPTVTP